MIEAAVLAIALSMDAFAVSVGLGAKQQPTSRKLAMQCACYFGIFQGLMPLIGYLGGEGVALLIGDYTSWLAFVLLVLIGAKMLYESFSNDAEDAVSSLSQRVMLMLAVATSIDAVAAGFSLTLLSIPPLVSCLLIALTTFLFSYVGVYIGKQSGTWLESKAELFGGLTLILIGFKLLLS